MPKTTTEKLFKVFDQSSQILEKTCDSSYLDAFIKTGQNILNHGQVQSKNGHPNSAETGQLELLYSGVDRQDTTAEDFRKAIQFTMIKAIQEDKIQANHQVTPDVIAFIMGYVVIRLLESKKSLRVLDLATGTSNLLTAVMYQLKRALHCQVRGIGLDNDDTLISISKISARLQAVNLQLFYQDSVGPLEIPAADLAISDLPIGYYPLDFRTKHYQTRFNKGHSYAHYLLIEQAMRHVKPGGFGEFLVPSNLFDTRGSKKLLSWLQTSVYLQGLLNLPKELFNNLNAQKAILLLQKHGGGAKQAKQVMIGEFPSFKKPNQFQKFMAEIVEWEENDLLR